MKLAVLRPWLLLSCVGLAPSAGWATDFNFNARNLNAPVFDASGNLIRRLTADSAAGPYSNPKLTHGQIEFFAVDSVQPIAVLNFDQALYQRSDDRLTGDDTVKLVTSQETLTGLGYECRPNAGSLHLRSNVDYQSDKIHLTGDRGDLKFDPKGGPRDKVVQDAVVTGNVVVVPAPGNATDFDRAETDSAHYDAAAQKVYLRAPVTMWKNGQKSLMNVGTGTFEINLMPKSRPPA